MNNTTKQPQTCYVKCTGKQIADAQLIFPPTNDKSVLNGYPIPVKSLLSVYIFTPEELEALKAEWMEEVPKMIDYCFQKIDADLLNRQQEFNRICSIKHHLKNYLDQNNPNQ